MERGVRSGGYTAIVKRNSYIIMHSGSGHGKAFENTISIHQKLFEDPR